MHQFTFTDDEFSDPLGLAKVGADLSVMVSSPLLPDISRTFFSSCCCNKAASSSALHGVC